MLRLFKFTMVYSIGILLYFISPSINGLRILGLFPFQVRSHHIMCGELMKGLAAKGHHVDVYSHYPLKNSLPNYHDFSLLGTLPAITNNLTFEVVKASSIEETLEFWSKIHQGPICNLLGHPLFQKLLHDPPRDPPYDLVIAEISRFHCFLPFGRHLNVPVIGVVTPPLLDWQYDGFSTPINLATDPGVYTSYVAPMTFFERFDNFISYKRTVRAFHKYSRPQDKYIEKYFGPGLPKVVDLLKDVSLVLVNHHASLTGAKPFAPKVIPVGGLHIVDRNETLPQVVQKWLDEGKHGCVYFSFGSMTRVETFPKHILHAFYKSFENIAPTRVLWKVAKPEELPPGLPANVLIQSWLQQMAVLKHENVKAFVTHGGLMGTQESIYFGVPMVGISLFGDQHANVKAYVKRNIAVQVEIHKITEGTFTNALREVLNNPLYRESVNKVSHKFKDRPLSAMDSAIFWVEYIHRHGKDALKSPVEDMPWWQSSLLDVYAFIAASVFLITVSTIILVKKLVIFSVKVYYQNSKLKKS